MKNTIIFYLLFLALISTKCCSQNKKNNTTNNQTWPFRVGIGFSVGYPEIPFINLGAKIHDKFCFDTYIGVKTYKKSPSYINFGYQKNNILKQEINLQFGPSLMFVKNKASDNIITTFGVHTKVTKIFINRIGVFLSGNIGLPDKRTLYENQINGNIGIEYYFKRVPILFY